MLGKLTDTAIRNAKPAAKPYRISDGGGMYLEISPTGGKLWRLKYRFGGKEKRLALGVYPDVSLARARERRHEARKLLAEGVDPGQERKAAKAAAGAQGDTFELLAREWHQLFLSSWSLDHAAKILTSLEKNAFPWIGHRPIRELLPPEILSVARRVEARGAVETAHRLVGTIGMVFRYAVAAGRADSDPTRDLRGALAPVNAANYPTITDPGELGALLRAINTYSGGYAVRAALRILPYVFVRPGELRGMTWAELQLDGPEPLWTIPAERMKLRRPHLVPLASQVVDILRDLQPVSGAGAVVFPGNRSRNKPYSETTLRAALDRLGYGSDVIVPHGFRGTASTLLNEMNYDDDWIEAQLAHLVPGVRGDYNHAVYLPDRRRMLQAWADYLDGLREGGRVIPMGHRNAG